MTPYSMRYFLYKNPLLFTKVIISKNQEKTMKKTVPAKKVVKKMDPNFGRFIVAGKGFGEINKSEYLRLEKLVRKNTK